MISVICSDEVPSCTFYFMKAFLRSAIFIGLGQIETSETQAAQNMKLLYVGMTRAKERLLITASGRNEFTEKIESMTCVVCAVA